MNTVNNKIKQNKKKKMKKKNKNDRYACKVFRVTTTTINHQVENRLNV